jgi:hypothetical protein
MISPCCPSVCVAVYPSLELVNPLIGAWYTCRAIDLASWIRYRSTGAYDLGAIELRAVKWCRMIAFRKTWKFDVLHGGHVAAPFPGDSWWIIGARHVDHKHSPVESMECPWEKRALEMWTALIGHAIGSSLRCIIHPVMLSIITMLKLSLRLAVPIWLQ